MELGRVIETAGTCRYFRPDDVPDETLMSVLDAARFAPSGANRQGVRFIVVRDPARRALMADWYRDIWLETMSQVDTHDLPGGVLPRTLHDADHFARHLIEVPVLIVVCARVDDLLPTDTGLDRISFVGGASVYPAVQNLLLKCREVGLGAALTTNLCRVEPQVKHLLGIPDDVATAATIAVGFPARAFPTRLARRPLGETAFLDRYGTPFTGTADT